MSIQTIAVVAALVALPVIAQSADPQDAARYKGASIPKSDDIDASVSSCSLSLRGDQAVLDATIVLPDRAEASHVLPHVLEKNGAQTRHGAGPHVQRGVDFMITPVAGGGMPVVEAMAINQKGTGATANGRLLLPAVQKHAINTKGTAGVNGRMSAGCDTVPSPGPTLTGSSSTARPVASCVISGDGTSASVSVPLSAFGAESKPYRGHVTLMKRGEDMSAMIQDGWSRPVVIAACSSVAGKQKPITTYDLATLKKA